jgi:RecA-family ATPase
MTASPLNNVTKTAPDVAVHNETSETYDFRLQTMITAARLARGGYVPVLLLPVKMKHKSAGKIPSWFDRGEWFQPNDWDQKAKATTVEELRSVIAASPSIANLGVLCGEPVVRAKEQLGFLAGVDIDCDAPELVAALARKFEDKFTCRKGRVDRSGCIPVVLAVDSLKGLPEVYHRKGADGDAIQVLKKGKQFAVFGGHPSGVFYRWEDSDGHAREIPSARSLPVITFEELDSLFVEHGFIRGAGKSGDKLDGKVKYLEAQKLLRAHRDGDLPTFESLTDGDLAIYEATELEALAKGVADRYEDEETNADNGIQSRNGARQSFINILRTKYPTMGIEFGFAVCLHFDAVCGEFVTSGKTTGQYTADQFVKDWNNASEANKALYEAELQGKAAARTELFGAVEADGYGSDEPSAEYLARLEKREQAKAIDAEVITPTDTDDAKLTKQQKKLDRLHKLFDCLADIGDVENDSVAWGIKHVTALCTTSIMIGMWGAGKSAIAIDMGFAQSIGQPWGGKKTVHGVVVYVALENHGDIKRRLRALRRRAINEDKDISQCAFVVWKAPIDLFDPKGTATRGEVDLIDVAMLNAERFQLPVVQVIIDTVAKSRGVGKENEATDAGLYIKSMDRIANATGANVMALHHPARGTDHARGSGAYEADCDTLLNVSKANGVCTVKASEVKFRIGDPSKARFTYKLHSEQTGIDEDGDPITVVLATSVGPADSKPGEGHPAEEDGGDDEMPDVLPGDKVADRERQIIDHVFEAEAERTRPADVSAARTLATLRLGVGEITKVLNDWRVLHKLPRLSRQLVQNVVFSMREKGALTDTGSKSRPVYALGRRSVSKPETVEKGDEDDGPMISLRFSLKPH